jgi:hypothetical protein
MLFNISFTQILIIIFLIFLIYGDFYKLKKKIKHFFNYIKKDKNS